MRFPLLPLAAFLCLVLSSPKPSAGETKSALNKASFEEYVRHLFVWGPQIQVKVGDPKPSEIPGFQQLSVLASAGAASQEEIFYVSKDGQKIVRGVIFDVNKSPFEADLKKLKTEFQPSFGTPGAPVVLVLFSDFQCGYCKEEAKMIRQNIPATYPKEVRVYFKDFPLEQIHPWAKTAAVAGRCVFRQKPAVFWDYHDWMFEHQGDITAENLKDKVLEFAKGKGLDEQQLGTCLDTRATEAEVDKNIAEGKALQINSTPTLFVNGRKLVGQGGWPQLRQIIDFEIDYQKANGDASAEKCCEVKLPSPLNP
ncbi:MAG: DsbA family protein [Bryobacteraceae bacterium]